MSSAKAGPVRWRQRCGVHFINMWSGARHPVVAKALTWAFRVRFLLLPYPAGLQAFPWWLLMTSWARKDPRGRGPRYKNGNNGHGSRPRTKSARHLPKPRPQGENSAHHFLVNGVKLQGVVTWFD